LPIGGDRRAATVQLDLGHAGRGVLHVQAEVRVRQWMNRPEADVERADRPDLIGAAMASEELEILSGDGVSGWDIETQALAVRRVHAIGAVAQRLELQALIGAAVAGDLLEPQRRASGEAEGKIHAAAAVGRGDLDLVGRQIGEVAERRDQGALRGILGGALRIEASGDKERGQGRDQSETGQTHETPTVRSELGARRSRALPSPTATVMPSARRPQRAGMPSRRCRWCAVRRRMPPGTPGAVPGARASCGIIPA
jgi:hypothetical protein